MRKPHKIQPIGPAKGPAVVLCLQCCTRRQYAGDADEYGTVAVAGWHCAPLRVTGPVSHTVPGGQGTDAASWWSYLSSTFRDTHDVTIVTAGAREHAALLGLWDLVLDGTYTVYGHDPQANGSSQGYVVLESPPTIIKFTESRSKRTYTWIDPANLGQRGFVGTADDGDATADTCRAVAEAVRDWYIGYLRCLNTLKLGGPENTAASQAAAGYRASYMDYPIYVHDNDAVLRMERAALYGGRNECGYVGILSASPYLHVIDETGEYPNWQAGMFDGPRPDPPDDSPPPKLPVLSGCGPIHQLDFNSLYPSVARDHQLPVKLRGVIHSPAVSTLMEACRCMPVIATVRVRTEVPCVPVWIDPLDGVPRSITRTALADGIHTLRHRMVFPTGDFLTCLCGPEIRLAHREGKIVSCGVAALYDGRPIYRRWVDTLYEARRAWADGDLAMMADSVKAILNSSFAKWAQLKRRWQDRPEELCPWPWDQWWRECEETGELEQWRCFAWCVQQLVVEGETGDSFPAITAYVNSLARVKLWDAIRACDPGKVYYYDTDSIWTDQAGFEQLQAAGWLHATELGRLKCIGSYDRVELFGLKRYLADGSLTVAGAHGETVRTSDAWALACRPLPTHSYLSAHRPPGIDLRTVRFRLNLPYEHGTVGTDGWVSPLHVTDR